jgi:hypothetical protein
VVGHEFSFSNSHYPPLAQGVHGSIICLHPSVMALSASSADICVRFHTLLAISPEYGLFRYVVFWNRNLLTTCGLENSLLHSCRTLRAVQYYFGGRGDKQTVLLFWILHLKINLYCQPSANSGENSNLKQNMIMCGLLRVITHRGGLRNMGMEQ